MSGVEVKPAIQNSKSEVEAVATLCPACGMCCNGVLFADVALQRTDDLARLRTLGVKWFAKGGKRRFGQPCDCLDGKLCRIYADRPERCRSFSCRLIQRMRAGEVTVGRALKSIAAARDAADAVLHLVGSLGEKDEAAPLSHRCSRIMAQPIDLGDDQAIIKRRSNLMLAVERLAKILERDFLT
jgi:Fe-S-cluster containining protein